MICAKVVFAQEPPTFCSRDSVQNHLLDQPRHSEYHSESPAMNSLKLSSPEKSVEQTLRMFQNNKAMK